jgi:predicted O-methyltransferase YrrM
MKFRTTSGDRFRIAALTLATLLVGTIAWKVIGEAALVLLTVLCLAVLLFTQIELAGLLKDHLKYEALYDFKQVEALFSLYSTLRPDLPLPDTRDWAASPDFLKKLTVLILKQEAQMVVETGSGVSTLVIGYCLKRLGRGKVISLEHDERYVTATNELINFHDLTQFACVIHCPLVKVDIGGETFSWYSTEGVPFERPIDILVVDGPPANDQEFPRYPALPQLSAHLAKNAFILLDDGRRAGESRTNKRWTAEFPSIRSEFLPTEKGAFLLRRVETSPGHLTNR